MGTVLADESVGSKSETSAAASLRMTMSSRLARKSGDRNRPRQRDRHSAVGNAPRVHVERVEAVACRHEEAIAPGAAEADVGAALRQMYVSQRLSRGREDANA